MTTKARIVVALEAIEDGDPGYAADVLRDLQRDLSPTSDEGWIACRFCGLRDFPGLIEKHERIVHSHEVIDLETERKAAA